MDIKNIKREDGKLSFQVQIDAEAFEKAVPWCGFETIQEFE